MHYKILVRNYAELKPGTAVTPAHFLALLGVTWSHFVPQTISDEIWLFNVENMPKPLPEWVQPLNIKNAFAYVGFGLSAEDAKEIERIKAANNN